MIPSNSLSLECGPQFHADPPTSARAPSIHGRNTGVSKTMIMMIMMMIMMIMCRRGRRLFQSPIIIAVIIIISTLTHTEIARSDLCLRGQRLPLHVDAQRRQHCTHHHHPRTIRLHDPNTTAARWARAPRWTRRTCHHHRRPL